jgi:hypothetical protein
MGGFGELLLYIFLESLGGLIIGFPIVYFLLRIFMKKKMNKIDVLKAFLLSWIFTSLLILFLKIMALPVDFLHKYFLFIIFVPTIIVCSIYFRRGKPTSELNDIGKRKSF